MDRPSPGMIAASLTVTAALLGVHATPSQALRCVLLTLAAGGVSGRLMAGRKTDSPAPNAVADALICAGFAFVAGPMKGVILALLATAGCLATTFAGDGRANWPGITARSAVLIVACLGGEIVAATGRWLHVWMQGALAAVCVICVIDASRQFFRPAKRVHD